MVLNAPQVPAQLQTGNTLKLPCEAAALLEFDNVQTLGSALSWCSEHRLIPIVLGEGSNVVLPQTLPRAVLRGVSTDVTVLKESCDAVDLRVGAGKNWHQLVIECVQAQRYGIENLALIPGSVGAAPVQNIGAYGVELSRFVLGVHGVDLRSGEPCYFDNHSCRFAYRDSVFKGSLDGFAITDVDLRLYRQAQVDLSYPALAERIARSGADQTPQAVFNAVVSLRRERLPDPALEPNAGSFFKNPVLQAAQVQALLGEYPALPVFPVDERSAKISAAWLIDQCGFRGAERGSVGVAKSHALVLVNRGGVQEDLLALADEIRQSVNARFGCQLEIEPVVYRGE